MCKPECRYSKANCNQPGAACLDPRFIVGDGIVFYFHGKSNDHFRLRLPRQSLGMTEVDHLKFYYDGKELGLPEGYPSIWECSESGIKVERTSTITKEDDRFHNYQLPSDDCFAHLDVLFRLYGLSTKVEGVLGRTYQPDFKNQEKPGDAMPIVGGEHKYRTSTLLSSKCNSCIFAPDGVLKESNPLVMDFRTLDCTGGPNSGHGIVRRK
ncbi:unnamed protein product [Withania somnifera]